MRASIKIFSMYKNINILVDEEKNKVICNGKEVNYNASDFCEKLLGIVIFWDSNMVNLNVVDAEKYQVEIFKDGENFIFNGMGKYPSNYKEFIKLYESVNI